MSILMTIIQYAVCLIVFIIGMYIVHRTKYKLNGLIIAGLFLISLTIGAMIPSSKTYSDTVNQSKYDSIGVTTYPKSNNKTLTLYKNDKPVYSANCKLDSSVDKNLSRSNTTYKVTLTSKKRYVYGFAAGNTHDSCFVSEHKVSTH